jgi:hypothetical protein
VLSAHGFVDNLSQSVRDVQKVSACLFDLKNTAKDSPKDHFLLVLPPDNLYADGDPFEEIRRVWGNSEKCQPLF